jgi:polyhydroxyalkanoate synthesis regulator phasin
MFDLLKKSVYAAIGVAVMTRETVEELGKKIANEAKLSESEGRQFIDELLKKSEETKAAMEKMVNEAVASTLKKLNVPSRTELENIENRLRVLEVKMGKSGT